LEWIGGGLRHGWLWFGLFFGLWVGRARGHVIANVLLALAFFMSSRLFEAAPEFDKDSVEGVRHFEITLPEKK
jgi:hypothetical protein